MVSPNTLDSKEEETDIPKRFVLSGALFLQILLGVLLLRVAQLSPHTSTTHLIWTDLSS